MRFTGPHIDLVQAMDKGTAASNPLQIGDDLYIDLEEPAVLVNHSCQPNAGIKDNDLLIAITDIEAGDEIFYDYSTSVSDDPWTMNCRCGSACCRGVIGDFRSLPPKLRKMYLERGIVQSFIAINRDRWGGDFEGSTPHRTSQRSKL